MLKTYDENLLRLRIWFVRFCSKYIKCKWGRVRSQIIDDEISGLTFKVDVNFRREISISIFDGKSTNIPQLLFNRSGEHIGTSISLENIKKN